MALVWYPAWQMECCGAPFAVGDTTAWSLSEKADVDWLEVAIGSDLAPAVTHVEDHHEVEGDAVGRTGTVRGIRLAACRYAPVPGADQRVRHPVAGTALITSVQRADGREGARDAGPDDRTFVGYLVELQLRTP